GLGYHPYFRIPFAPGAAAADSMVRAPAREMWPLVDSLPTGERRPCDPARDLNTPRRFVDLQLDDVLTGAPAAPDGPDGLCARGAVSAGREALRLRTSPALRELVVFPPPHRQPVFIE